MEILEEKISRENKVKSETNNGWHKGGKREIKGAASGWLRHNALSAFFSLAIWYLSTCILFIAPRTYNFYWSLFGNFFVDSVTCNSILKTTVCTREI